jgi:hypothetical protein
VDFFAAKKAYQFGYTFLAAKKISALGTDYQSDE